MNAAAMLINPISTPIVVSRNRMPGASVAAAKNSATVKPAALITPITSSSRQPMRGGRWKPAITAIATAARMPTGLPINVATGTPNVPAHYAASAGYDLIEEVGVDRIRESSLRQTQLLIDLADEAGFEVRSPRAAARRGGTVTVHVPGFPAVHRELMERQILCDFRPDAGIRLGPHYYNTDDELRFVVEQIEEILETGAHERHLGVVAQH